MFFTEKKDECVYEVSLPPEDSAPKESEDEENEMKKKGVGAMVKVFQFIMKQSYICALIAMMVSTRHTFTSEFVLVVTKSLKQT